ncbi:MAG: drug/metabolite exporter YedA [Anaerolineae bacterium]|nr:drug/metabolite exporter YedA [Anaerolineae bacterium]
MTAPSQVIQPAKPIAAAPSRTPLWIGLSLLATYVIWGSTYFAIRIGLESFPPFLMIGLRFTVAGSVLYAVLRWQGSPAPTRGQWGRAGIVGACLIGGGMAMSAFAGQYIASALVALIVTTSPLWTALFAGLWGEWPSRQEWIGLVLGLIGTGLLSAGGDTSATLFGIVLVIAAAAAWGLGSAWSRQLDLPDGLMATAAQMLIGGVIVLAVSLVRGERLTAAPTLGPLLALVYLITFGSLIAFSAYNYLLKHVRPALAASNSYVNPVIALGLGVGFAGEQMPSTLWLALPLILVGVGCVLLRKQAPAKDETA